MGGGFDIGFILHEARTRWLEPSEITHILHNNGKFELVPEGLQIQKPHSGTLFLYDVCVHHSWIDGYWWKQLEGRMDGEGPKLLKVEDAETEVCRGRSKFMERKSYSMLDGAHKDIVLVHYRRRLEDKPRETWRLEDHGNCCLHDLSFQWATKGQGKSEIEASESDELEAYGRSVLDGPELSEEPESSDSGSSDSGSSEDLASPTNRRWEEGEDEDEEEMSPFDRLSRYPQLPDNLNETEASNNAVPEQEAEPISSHAMCEQWTKGTSIGKGSFGDVYSGFNRENGKFCAIKIIMAGDTGSSKQLEELNKEIVLHRELKHTNIVQYYGSEMTGVLSIYLELVPYGSIHKLLQDYGCLKEPVIRDYTAKILRGLAYLHSRRTVHRDIKGANILVGPNGEIKLADFGMAKKLISSRDQLFSNKGTAYWMAPEVIRSVEGRAGHNEKADIWSLGCTIIEMATAKHPWHEEICLVAEDCNPIAGVFRIGDSNETPKIPEKSKFSEDGKKFLQRCLQRDPAHRATAAELLNDPYIRNRPAL